MPASGLSLAWHWLTRSRTVNSLSAGLGWKRCYKSPRRKKPLLLTAKQSPGWVPSCHPLSQPQLSSGIWSLRNYCKRSKALGKAGLRVFFQVIFFKAFFASEDSRGPILPSCCQHYMAKPSHEVVREHWNAKRLQEPGVGRCVRENSIQSRGCLRGISVIFLFLYCLNDKANKGKKGLKRAESLLFHPFTDQNPFMQLQTWESKCVGLQHGMRMNSIKKKGRKKQSRNLLGTGKQVGGVSGQRRQGVCNLCSD